MAVLSNYSLLSALVLSLLYAGSVPSDLCASLALLALAAGGVFAIKGNTSKWITGALFGIPVTYAFLDLISLGHWFSADLFHLHLPLALAIASTGLAMTF